MARADLLYNLVKAGNVGDQKLFVQAVEALVAEERAKQHHVVADRLLDLIRQNGRILGSAGRSLDEGVRGLVFETTPNRSLSDLILSAAVCQALTELIEEYHRRDLLRSYNLEPRHRVLLAGPPGNGKTTVAEALADALLVPLVTIRYEGVIGSYLGETASRLRRVMDYVRTRHCVLFIDEFDTIGKERGDEHELGEIKRVVSSLLLQIDSLPSHVVIVTATNHPELLDRAVWRRFQLRLFLPPPGTGQILEWVRRFKERLGVPLKMGHKTLAEHLKGLSFAELEEFGADVQRRYVLGLPGSNANRILTERIEQWRSRFTATENSEVPCNDVTSSPRSSPA